MAWTTPITWAIRDAITMVKLNAHLRDNMNYLFARNKHVLTIISGSDLTTTSTTYGAVDDAQFTLTLDVTDGAELEFNLLGNYAHSVLNGTVNFDIIMDDVTYLSNMTATPITHGIWRGRAQAAAAISQLGGNPFYVSNIAAGVHTFKLRWKVTTAGTGTLYLNSYMCQFGVHER